MKQHVDGALMLQLFAVEFCGPNDRTPRKPGLNLDFFMSAA